MQNKLIPSQDDMCFINLKVKSSKTIMVNTRLLNPELPLPALDDSASFPDTTYSIFSIITIQAASSLDVNVWGPRAKGRGSIGNTVHAAVEEFETNQTKDLF